MALKVLITGGSGLLGKYLLESAPQTEVEFGSTSRYDIQAPTRQGLDVSNIGQTLEYLFSFNPDIIIHCAANGDVDSVEKDPTKAIESDLMAIINLKKYCEMSGCKLVTISSNAVYDGENPPYGEISLRNPVNMYGKLKSLSDSIIEGSKCDWMIIRPIMMYGWPNPGKRGNWVTKLINHKGPINLVDDSYTQPIYADDVAEGIWDLIEKGAWRESFNFASEDKITIYEFGVTIREVFGLYIDISPVKLSTFASIAPRPIDTTFNIAKIKRNGIDPCNVFDGLTVMKNEH